MPTVSELEIKLRETLTSKACSRIVIHLIKYILYQAEQIPVDYESFIRFFKKCKEQYESGENENRSSSTYKQMQAQRLYKIMESLVSNCENTFQNLETEFVESNGIEEIVVIVGATKVLPKKIFRIVIPSLSVTNCDLVKADSRNLQSICRHVITSDELHDYFKDKTNPTNVFIFLKMHQESKPKTKWFIPNEDFRLSEVCKQMKIYLQPPSIEDASLSDVRDITENGIIHLNRDSNHSDLQTINDVEKICFGDVIEWYQSKECLRGLKRENSGISVFSLLSKK